MSQGCLGVDTAQIDCETALPVLVGSQWRLLWSYALAKHFHNRFNQSQLQKNLIHYVQALATHLDNHFDWYQLQRNLDSLPTSTSKAVSQLFQSVSTLKQP